jgi:hypothetical protein
MLRPRLILACVLASITAAVLVGSASAANVTFERAGSIEMPSSGKLTFGEGSTTIQCEFTFNGTLARGPIEATAGRQVGSITEVSINRAECTGGELERVLGLPWALVYDEATPSQAGLPNNITGLRLRIINFNLLLSTFFGIVNCLWAGNLGLILSVTQTRTPGLYNTPTSPLPLRADETNRLAKNTERSSGACQGTISIRSTLALNPGPQAITIT